MDVMEGEQFEDAKELADYWMKYNGPENAQVNREVWFAYRDSLRRMIDALLARVDRDAREECAKVCSDKMRQRSKESDDEKRNGTDRAMRALLNQALGAAICEEAIRSTIDAKDGDRKETKETKHGS